jgi:hypothetical protein
VGSGASPASTAAADAMLRYRAAIGVDEKGMRSGGVEKRRSAVARLLGAEAVLELSRGRFRYIFFFLQNDTLANSVVI